MAEANCPCCGKGGAAHWCDSGGFKIMRCGCGVSYPVAVPPNTAPSDAEINEIYNKNEASGVQDYLEIEGDNKKDFESRLDFIISYIGGAGTLLDIGCNIGSLLDVAQRRGWRVEGVDINKTAVKIAKERGLKCRSGDFSKIGKKFDLIVMNDVLEHLPNPNRGLRCASKLLKSGGHIYISTPDSGSAVARLARGRWIHMKPREHLCIFTKGAILRLLEEEGFEILRLSAVGRTRSAGLVIRKMKSCAGIFGALELLPRFAKGMKLHINLSDEMQLIARKKKRA
ncbi:MAG: class I SAM-dependent methyltransferase [Candidatus Diapherotrites archaeon]